MDSKSATTSAEHHDNMAAVEFQNLDQPANETQMDDAALRWGEIAKLEAERRSNPPNESLKRDADVAQTQMTKLQLISPTDQTSQLKECVQVLENEEASKETESAALMAEGDRPSRIPIVPDEHSIFAGLPDIIALPDLGNTYLMHGSHTI